MLRRGLILLVSSVCNTLTGASEPSHAASFQTAVNPLAESMVSFRKRVDAYLDLRNGVAKKMPEVKETGDPAKISDREKALGQAIAAARQEAKAGDVFGPDLSPHLRHILDEDWKKRSAKDRQALFAEIPPGLQLKVNQAYPTNLPLVTVPAGLLAQLPTIPEALEYRLVDRRLLLRDRDANLIVDVLVGTKPTTQGK
jgi:hypothetical protein